MQVFISSTSSDLAEYRKATFEEILRFGLSPVMMEFFGCEVQSGILGACLQRVSESELVIAILGWRRGGVPEQEVGGDGDSSYTALEIKKAKELNIPLVVLMAGPEWPAERRADSEEEQAWVEAFRRKLDRPAVFFGYESSADIPAFRSLVVGEIARFLRPKFDSGRIQELSRQLIDAEARKVRLEGAGCDVSSTDEEIIEIKKKIRDGFALKNGALLCERYLLLEPIGHGGFATVWKAMDVRGQRRRLVAVKVLHGRHANDRSLRERFVRGARRMGELEHPGIVRLISNAREHNGYLFFVMEYLDGGDLRKAVLQKELRYKGLQAIYAVGEALHAAHCAGLVHRDIKPANIVLANTGQPKITDFDLVLASDSTGGTRTGGHLGSFVYAAPELWQQPQFADERADVYGLAMTAVFVLYGRDLPIDVIGRQRSFISGLGIRRAVKDVLLKALSWDVDARYVSVEEFCADLLTSWEAESAVAPQEPSSSLLNVRSQIQEVLLVSSPFEAFSLEQDGRLTGEIFREYAYLSLPAAPRLTHVIFGNAAIDLLSVREFDLVIFMASLTDTDVVYYAKKAKKVRADKPVALLAVDSEELNELHDTVDGKYVDAIFLWGGDPRIFLVIVKYFDDRQSVELGEMQRGQRVVVVVEDSPAYYSKFLSALYQELTDYALSLYNSDLGRWQRQVHMKSRPKILHAASLGIGRLFLDRYGDRVLALFCSVGSVDNDASVNGFDFIREVRSRSPHLAIVAMSDLDSDKAEAREVEVAFLNKESGDFHGGLRAFLEDSLGFGDFVFRNAEGAVFGRAKDLEQLEEVLSLVDSGSLRFHTMHNHFSTWLLARSEFELADHIRPIGVEDFPDTESLRGSLVSAFRKRNRLSQRGQVTSFDEKQFDRNFFMVIGRGSVGGKAHGLQFWNMRLADFDKEKFLGVEVKLPRTLVVATEYFVNFIEANRLLERVLGCDDAGVIRLFSGGDLSAELVEKLRVVVRRFDTPLAVRSSSLLEESLRQRLSGIYRSFLLPNNSPDIEVRLQDLVFAVKMIFASCFLSEARAFISGIGRSVVEEEMAVIIQQVVGTSHGERFYPTYSGVAQSYNFYPILKQEPEEGVVQLALGLGHTVVEGGQARRFSPGHPKIDPYESEPERFLEYSQRRFYAIDMNSGPFSNGSQLSGHRPYDLKFAEKDGVLATVGSVYNVADKKLVDSVSCDGPRLVTFNNFLKHDALPISHVMRQLLELGKESLGRAVEIEFAGNVWKSSGDGWCSDLYILQILPFAARSRGMVSLDFELESGRCLCVSRRCLGNGVISGVRDVIYVRYDRWDRSANSKIALELAYLNSMAVGESRSYTLIGPGRWGSSDEWLGVPVRWSQVSNVKVIVEASPDGYGYELSESFHFFHNLTSLGVGYLPLAPGSLRVESSSREFLDTLWLDDQPAYRETDHLRWLRFDQDLSVALDGRKRRGVIGKPKSILGTSEELQGD